MRKRQDIEKEAKGFSRTDILVLETLLDVRDLLQKQAPKKRGRPKKTK